MYSCTLRYCSRLEPYPIAAGVLPRTDAQLHRTPQLYWVGSGANFAVFSCRKDPLAAASGRRAPLNVQVGVLLVL